MSLPAPEALALESLKGLTQDTRTTKGTASTAKAPRLSSGPKRKVQAFSNPAFEEDGVKKDTAITMLSLKEDLIEVMFPNSTKLFRRMMYQVWAVYFLILAHTMVIGYTDPLDTAAKLTQVIVFSVQVGLLIAIIMAFFVLTSQTLLIQLGRYDRYLQEFKYIYGIFFLELLLYIALKVYSTVLIYQRVSYLAFWGMKSYYGLWLAQRIFLLLFWVQTAYSSTAVFNEKYFDPRDLMNLDQA